MLSFPTAVDLCPNLHYFRYTVNHCGPDGNGYNHEDMSPEAAAVVFGLASAISWGAGDFSGGVASKRTNVYLVIVISQIFGVMMLAALALLRGEPLPDADALLLGAAAGLAGAVGLVALYRGLATSHMGVVAPLTAVVAAGLPVVVGALIEGTPGVIQLLGFGCALAGVQSRPGADNGRRRSSGGAHKTDGRRRMDRTSQFRAILEY